MPQEKKESVPTIGAILQRLTIQQVAAIGSFAATIIMSVLAGGIYLGQNQAKSDSSQQLAEKSGLVTSCQTQLALATEGLQRLGGSNKELQDANRTASGMIQNLQQQVSVLTANSVGQKNCAFIHAEIESTKAEMWRARNGTLLFSADRDTRDTDQRLAALESRLANYQQQLGTCAGVSPVK